MDIPSDMRYMVAQLSGYSRNTVKIQSLNQNTLSTNGGATQLRFSLPVSSIVNMESLSMHGSVQTYGVAASGAAGADANGVIALIPRGGISALLDRVSWTAGGIALDSGHSLYNLVYAMKENIEKSSDKFMSDDRVLAQSTIDVPAAPSDSTNWGQRKQLVQNNFLGFTQCAPCYLDASLLPELFCTMQLADSSVLPVNYQGTTLGNRTPLNAPPAGKFNGSECRFAIEDIFFTIEVLSVGNGVLSALQERLLQRDGSIDCPYFQHQVFTTDASSAGVSLRGSVSTMSLNKMYGCFRNTAPATDTPVPLMDPYTQQQPPVKAEDNCTFAYQQAFCNLISGGIQDWSFRLNNSPYPLYKADTLDAYNYAVCANDRTYRKDAGSLVGSQDTWKNNCWVACQRLSHNDDPRLVSGMDLRSINSQINFDVGAAATGSFKRQAVLVTEQVSMLRIGEGRSLAVIA